MAVDIPTGDSTTIKDGWVTVGHIVGVFGIHGEVKVEPLTSFPERFATTQVLYAGVTCTPYKVLRAHPHKQHMLIQFEGVLDIDAAERLRGLTLSIPAEQIHELPEDQFYLHDVIGLTVMHANGQKLGLVKDILVTGAADLFVVESTKTGNQVLLPAVKEFIKSIDLATGILEVDTIPGLFEDDFDAF